MDTRVWAWRLCMAACLMLSGCGGGGGGVTTPEVAPEVQIQGTIYVLGAAGTPLPAPAGTPVVLRSVQPNGDLGPAASQTTTSDQGSYRLSLGPGVTPGTAWAAVATTTQGAMHALATNTVVDVSPASEVVFQAVLDTTRARGAMPVETSDRMARFVTAAGQFLHLIDLHATELQTAITELRAWLNLDPATTRALEQLRADGRLPAALGDIGGLFGITTAAWETVDGDGQPLRFRLRPRPGAANELELLRSTAGAATDWSLLTTPALVFRLDGQGVSRLSGFTPTTPFDVVLGTVRVGAFGVALGATEQLDARNVSTAGYSFDGDNLPDQLDWRSEQRVLGYDTITHDGAPTRTLRVELTQRAVVSLSAGGTLSYTQATTSWLAPFGGALLTRIDLSTVDGQGRTQQSSQTQRLTAGVIQGMSWPGRLHKRVRTQTVPEMSVDTKLTPLFAPDLDHVVLMEERTQATEVVKTLRVLTLPEGVLTHQLALPEALSPEQILLSQMRIAPDRQSIFLALSRRQPDNPFDTLSANDMPDAQAQALAGEVVRFDARTLTEMRRVRLPAVISTLLPQRAFPRNRISNILVSPVDSASFAVASSGLLQYGATGDLPIAELTASDAEAPLQGGATLQREQFDLKAWQPEGQQLWVRLRNTWAFTQPASGEYLLSTDPHRFTLGDLMSIGNCCQGWYDGEAVLLPEGALDTAGADTPQNAEYRRLSGLPDTSHGSQVLFGNRQGEWLATGPGYVSGGVGFIDIVNYREWPRR